VRSVRIRTPARLHFGLFADGRGPRKFGGVGLAIDKPGFDVELRLAAEDSVHSPTDPTVAARVSTLLARLRDRMPTIPVAAEIREAIPAHVGLGSGTQLALALTEAYSLLCRASLSPRELANAAGRGKRSGVGWHVYFEGGFVIDAGRSDESGISPALTQFFGFPYGWRVVLFRLELPPGLHGPDETAAFRNDVAIPDEVTSRLCDLVLRRLAPAAAREQYDEFGDALYEYNRASGECFASVQGGAYAHPNIQRLVNDVRRAGCSAVGQSSWGPTVFAICPSEERAQALTLEIGRRYETLTSTVVAQFPFGRDIKVEGTDLLVSVQSVEEAAEAIRGGVDVLDVKDTAKGPLGVPAPGLASAIHESLPERVFQGEKSLNLSVALGELHEAEHRETIDGFRDFSCWFKVGFAGERGRSDWDVRFFALSALLGATERLIPAAYADAQRADGPPWASIVERVVTRFPDGRRLLVDTFSKQTNFWDALGGKEGVRELFDVCEKERIHLALAGSLKIDDVDRLADEVGRLPHVIAVRGAVCNDGIRTNSIDRARVAELQRRIIAAELRLDRRGPPRGWR
jgi:beta-ribofuranosylaminobenzene 5'-phosphate synthase